MFDPNNIRAEAQEKYKFEDPFEPGHFDRVLRLAIIRAYNAGLNKAIELCDDSREILQEQLIKE